MWQQAGWDSLAEQGGDAAEAAAAVAEQQAAQGADMEPQVGGCTRSVALHANLGPRSDVQAC
jgi:hypothetical protein